jgi:hypothetical protein
MAVWHAFPGWQAAIISMFGALAETMSAVPPTPTATWLGCSQAPAAYTARCCPLGTASLCQRRHRWGGRTWRSAGEHDSAAEAVPQFVAGRKPDGGAFSCV